MGTSISLNATSYTIPATSEDNWGIDVTNYLVALSTGVLSKAGGAFTLTADADFGANYGLKSLYYKSRGTVAASGIFRLANAETVAWRNAANSADLALTVDNSNVLTFNSNPIVTLALGSANHVLKMNSGGTAYEFGSITNANVDASAAIAYSKLALTGNIVNADISTSAAVAYSKLNLAGSIVDADVNASAAIAQSKLALDITNSEINASAAIAQSKLALDITNAEINAAAAIAYSKLAALTASRVLVSDGSGFVSASSVTSTTLGYLDATSSIQTQLDAKAALAGATFTGNVVMDNAQAIRFSETDANGSHYIGIKAPDSVTADVTFTLPNGDGSANQVLKTDGSAGLGWATVATVEESIAVSAPSTNQSIGTSDESIHIVTPTADVDYTLDNTYSAGRNIKIVNRATAYDITVKANDASTICVVSRGTQVHLVCTSSTPATNTSWQQIGDIVGKWTTYTQTYNNGPTSPTVLYSKYKRDGQGVRVRLHVNGGTGGAASVLGLDWDIPNTTPDIADGHYIPLGSVVDGGGVFVGPMIGVWSAANSRFTCYFNDANATTVYNGSSWTSGRKLVFDFHVPVTEWA